MARRLQSGALVRKGPSWLFRWWEDVIDASGSQVRKRRSSLIGAATGPEAMTETEALQKAQERILARVNRTARAMLFSGTLAEYVRVHFLPGHVAKKKAAGTKWYTEILRSHVLPSLGTLKFDKVAPAHIQAIIDRLHALGRSHSLCDHVRDVVSGIYTYALKTRMFDGLNPASGVELPEAESRTTHSLSPGQLFEVLQELTAPVRWMAAAAALTSMNVGELAALRWRRVNLTETPLLVDGEVLAPMAIAVREQCYRGQFGSVKAKSRRRELPLSPALIAILNEVQRNTLFSGPNDLVFCSSRGTPVDDNNVRYRHFRPLKEKLGLPELGWHTFRRSHATLAEMIGMQLSDRIAMLGHHRAMMTMRYTASDLERRRQGVTVMERLIAGGKPAPEGVPDTFRTPEPDLNLVDSTAQLVRAPALQAGSLGFESLTAHHFPSTTYDFTESAFESPLWGLLWVADPTSTPPRLLSSLASECGCSARAFAYSCALRELS